MRKPTKKDRSNIEIQNKILLLFTVLMFSIHSFSQSENKINSNQTATESKNTEILILENDKRKKDTSFFRFLKYRSNEEERINNYLDSIIGKDELRIDTLNLDFTLKEMQKSFETKNKNFKDNKVIIGWHSNSESSVYKNYNYNYLTAINLFSYEVNGNGSLNNSNDIYDFMEPSGIIDVTQRNFTDVYLTIHMQSEDSISKFLNSVDYQKVLISELRSYAEDDCINGINIYFENIAYKDALRFELFAKNMYKQIKFNNPTFSLNISLPGIYSIKSLRQIDSYNFSELNPITHNYIVLTDRITNLNNNWAQAASPLHSYGDTGYGTIESTINFYSNGKIPLSKIIMTVSYQGIVWPVKEFKGKNNGKVDRSKTNVKKEYIKYNEIINDFINDKGFKSEVNMNLKFDSVQVAAYINIIDSTNNDKPQYFQLWYENKTSLTIKYEWLLSKNLAGLSIRYLGFDNGYNELWDVIGATLMKMDTTSVNQ